MMMVVHGCNTCMAVVVRVSSMHGGGVLCNSYCISTAQIRI